MVELLSDIGVIISAGITLIGLSFAFLIRISWKCGLCGKTIETGLLRFIFCMCDHEGDT
jgi:hypothetical protein